MGLFQPSSRQAFNQHAHAASVAELGDRAAQRGKVARQAVRQNLVDVLGIR